MRIRQSSPWGRCTRALSALVVVSGAVVAAAFVSPAPAGAVTNGPTWMGTAAPLPANAGASPDASVDGQSCPAPGACVVVGGYFTGGQSLLFADTLTNGAWSTTQITSPPHDNGNDTGFRSLTCPTVGFCVATGEYETSASAHIPFAAELSGGTWTTVALPLPPAAADPNISLSDFNLSCPSAGWCVQAGSFVDSSSNTVGFIDTLSGGGWTSIVAPMPNGAPPDPGLDIFAVSCGVVGSCVTVGPYNSSNDNLIDVLAGGTWTATDAPLPNNAGPHVNNEVESVSCAPGSTGCIVVGHYTDSNNFSQNVAWSVSGASITATEVATPPDVVAGNPQASLNDVSCPVAGWCMAVGQYDSTSFTGGNMEAAVLSGGSWTVQEPPGNSAMYQYGVLGEVSCSWPGSCAAAGTLHDPVADNNYALINTYMNGVWSGNNSVLPNGGNPTEQNEVGGPSCVAGYCLAGGYYDFSLTESPFVESYPNLTGYQQVASDGGLFSFNAPYHGSMGGKPLNAPVVGMAVQPDNGGYYEVASDGGIFAFDAPFQGSMGGKPLNKPVVGMAFDTQTGGYYEVASDGGIFAFNAPFYGSMGGKPLNSPIVGMAFDPATGGYYEVAADGGVFAFGTPFQGSMGGKPINRPMVGMAVDSSTGGYYEVASDGGVFAFGAPFQGSTGGTALGAPFVGIAFDYNTGGYYEAAADGGLFAFGAHFQGSMGGQRLNKPIVGLASG